MEMSNVCWISCTSLRSGFLEKNTEITECECRRLTICIFWWAYSRSGENGRTESITWIFRKCMFILRLSFEKSSIFFCPGAVTSCSPSTRELRNTQPRKIHWCQYKCTGRKTSFFLYLNLMVNVAILVDSSPWFMPFLVNSSFPPKQDSEP